MAGEGQEEHTGSTLDEDFPDRNMPARGKQKRHTSSTRPSACPYWLGFLVQRMLELLKEEEESAAQGCSRTPNAAIRWGQELDKVPNPLPVDPLVPVAPLLCLGVA